MYPGVKNFTEIALLPFLRKIRFCILHRNLRWLPKVAGKNFLGEVATGLYRYPGGKQFCRNRIVFDINALAHTVSEIKTFLEFTQKFKMAKNDLF